MKYLKIKLNVNQAKLLSLGLYTATEMVLVKEKVNRVYQSYLTDD